MNEQSVHYDKISDVPDAVWQKFSTKSIYFGHQSVGFNILDGVSAILKEKGNIPLTIEEKEKPEKYNPGAITHSTLGKNTDPESKLNAFISLVNEKAPENADIMFFKFCYIDFNSETDVGALFNEYQRSFEQLKKEHPKTQFVHVTAPLTTIKKGGIKTWIKKIIGKPLRGITENIKRHEYNEMIRATYSDKEPIFDIAAIESTFPDGKRATFESNKKIYYTLVPEYTNDGGHLNEIGKKAAAEQLLLTLANLL